MEYSVFYTTAGTPAAMHCGFTNVDGILSRTFAVLSAYLRSSKYPAVRDAREVLRVEWTLPFRVHSDKGPVKSTMPNDLAAVTARPVKRPGF